MNEQQAGSRTQIVTAEVALRAVVEQVARASGGEFYRRLAAALGGVFGACYAGIGEIAAGGARVSMLGSWTRQDATSPSEFTLAGTPAADIALGRTTYHPDRVRRNFPSDQRLQRLFAESYLGVPITDARGDVLGLIELVADGPLPNVEAATSILMAMAERAVVELERDQAEAALRDSEMRYRALIEDSFHLVAEVVDERYVYVSSGYTDALGYAPEELLGGSIFDLIHAEERRPTAGELQAMLAQRRAARFTVRMQHREGSWRWIECTARAFRASSGEYRTTLFSRDITDRRFAEETLRESEELFRTLIKDLRVGVVLHDADARVLVCNDAALTLLGLTEEQILGRTSYDDDWNPTHEDGTVIPPHERPVPLAIATGKPVRDMVYGVHRESTQDVAWVLASAEPQFDSNGAVHRVICSIIDITARLAAERELRESESRFRFLAENSTDVIARYDREGVCIWVSPSVKAAAGYEPEEVIGHSLTEFFQDNTSLLDYALSEVEAGREAFRTTFPLRHKDGRTVWMEAINRVIRDPATGEIVEIHASSRDVTTRKAAEDELRESEARFRLLAENSTDIIGRYTPEGACIWISPSIKVVTGLDPEMAVGQVPGDHIHPDDREGRLDVMRALVAGQDQATQTFRFRHVDGHYIWLEAHVRAIRDAEGNLIEIQTSSRDVTARKHAEDELRESEARFRLLAENATDMIARFAPDGRCTWVSPSAEAITGLTPDEVMRTAPDARIHPEDAPAVWDAFTAMVEGQATRRATFRYLHRDGHYIWLEADGRAIRDGSGRVVEIHSSTRDVTARMVADDELRESESRFRLIAENASDMIGRYTPDSVCLWVSPSVTSILGYEPSELIGTNVREGIHPEDLQRITDLPDNWQRPDTTTKTLRYRHKDGHYIWVESTSKAVRDPLTGEI
ncbi:MAG: PAS domain S-box protein, partial [Chloroflexi bacterium]|nr:PAS domain S-box protein [Chloroflexota bacterium]